MNGWRKTGWGRGEDGGGRNGFKNGWLKRNGWRWVAGFQLGEKTMWKISCDLIFNMSVITFLVAISLSLWSLINSVYSLLFTMHEMGHPSEHGLLPYLNEICYCYSSTADYNASIIFQAGLCASSSSQTRIFFFFLERDSFISFSQKSEHKTGVSIHILS